MRTRFKSVLSDEVDIEISDRTSLGDGIVLGPNCKKLKIGYGCFLGRDIYIDVEELVIGDYTTIHHGSIIHGKKTSIGHNCWIGHYTIIDSLGGDTKIMNNVGIGAHSQVWSHMKFGDVLNGCRWDSSGSVLLEDDVWLVGHCIVGPIHAEKQSMLMTGGVQMKGMKENSIYAGSPAFDITSKVGVQFNKKDEIEKRELFCKYRFEFCKDNNCSEENFVIVNSFISDCEVTQFNLADRSYFPVRSELEYKFIKYMLYEKAKWTPFIQNKGR